MLGLMQDWPLLIPKIIDHAAKQHGTREVVTRSVEGPIVRTDYAAIRARALKVAQRLTREGVRPGDRIATLAWNTARHLETWYGITGAGAIYHTVNPRLFPEQIVWIVNHAEDRMVLVDPTFVPLLEAIASRLPTVERYVVLTDAAHMPKTALKNAVAYEDWIGECDGDFRWLELDERSAAGLCYTSGTTGDPKGVLYSHRSNVLHGLAASMMDCLAISANTTILPIVPLFHANSWSIAFSAPMVGAKMVMPGPKLDGASVYELLETEQVTCTAGVPTVWAMLLQYLEKENKTFSTLKRLVIGGSAAPRAMIEAFEKRYGVEVIHAWGMTEMSPLGTVCSIKPVVSGLKGDALYDLKSKQGHTPFMIEMKITDDEGKELPWDGKTFGRLKVAGPAVVKAYYRGEGSVLDDRGFFDTGDVATIDEHGYMAITDRSKDVIKSGGEWISSIDLENIACGHPDVAEAAVIGIRHPKWDERPLLVVVQKPDHTVDKAALLAFLSGKIAKWWMPDDVQIVSEIPHTATGKINKVRLREQFVDYRLPTAV
ncbi:MULTISPECIES: long-chain-fatty-acid--CoA ligase [unclassified Beijerinckia]|uniref:long-chain-fatty-acid--CoA ligase n=1 Tax=unclassified Beijerinckia TaxID=2638183 RepID=UPI0008995C87|nr:MULTISPECIES: long-chain-fatty-acid--CoA ligase [unclassified Beijerinckia]MDH7796510.1 fatty-acyl-CoA synthase [Beijerinckia sp. GAS462]SEC48192.1 fatty-acyl-CoA synthase [Beijerinckia sp. 28-YEA-48]